MSINNPLLNTCQNIPIILVLIAVVSVILNIFITYKPIKRILAILQYVCATIVLLTAFFQLLDDSHKYNHNTQFTCNAETTIINSTHYTYKFSYVPDELSDKILETPELNKISASVIHKYRGIPPKELCEYIPCWYDGLLLSNVKINYYVIYINSIINFVLVICLLSLLFAL
jgi:hypothetical protein